MGTPGVRAVIKLHTWAGSFKGGKTLYGSMQELRNGDLKGTLKNVIGERLPPVKGFKEAVLRSIETEKTKATACPGSVFTAMAYFRSWGMKIDVHVAGVMLSVLERQYRDTLNHVNASPDAVSATLSSDDSVQLNVKRLRLLQSWMSADNVPLDSLFVKSLLRFLFSISRLGADLRLKKLNLNDFPVWCLAIPVEITRSLLRDLDVMGVVLSRESLDLAARIFINGEHLPEADALLTEQARQGYVERNLPYRLLLTAAISNDINFPNYIMKWGDGKAAALTAMWYSNGKGMPCPVCGDPSNHRSSTIVAKNISTPVTCEAFKNPTQQYMRRDFMHYDRPDNAEHLSIARSILRFTEKTAPLTNLLTCNQLLRMAAKAPAADFDKFLQEVSETSGISKTKLFQGRLLHYCFREREKDIVACLQDVFSEGDVGRERALVESSIAHVKNQSLRESLEQHMRKASRSGRRTE
eukprot:TRINITY_DN18996_c0_g1_i1.p1 TRINITY_DN18996_c0_g1~~TRINITY_DN18996_c0_g1_i1.p1  ORF type:complete len:468 (+),score=73.86 TRINITY_DN18996_c0_g1_i1:28-1431(+)